MSRAAPRTRVAVLVAVVLALTALAISAPLPAQDPAGGAARESAGLTPEGEARLLQSAAQREAAGELDAAASLLRDVLEGRPSSVPALLALERVLSIQGRLDALPPLVAAALEREPGSPLLNRLAVRSWAALDRPAELERAADAWIRRMPTVEVAYREVARIWTERGEYGRARAVLERGRSRVDAPDALALELGALHADLGDAERAAEEWERAIVHGGLRPVQRRLRGLPDGGAEVAARLVGRLGTDAGDGDVGRGNGAERVDRADAALALAVEAGLEDEAMAIAGRLVEALPPDRRAGRLWRLGLDADRNREPRLAYWAYRRLAALPESVAGGGAVARQEILTTRLEELAAELGETGAGAAGSGSAPVPGQGANEARVAAARVELLASRDPAEATEAFHDFRARFPDSPALDRLAVRLAERLDEAGDGHGAELLLQGVAGPEAARLRARLLLQRGELEAARASYLAAAQGLPGVQATAALSLATMLGRVSQAGARVLGQAVALRERGRAGEAVDRIRGALERLEPADAPPLLDYAATLADEAGLARDARSLRREIVGSHPRSTEAPAALLALAQGLAGEPGRVEEARELLERLVVEYPRSALVPQARRALDGLEERESR